MGKPVPRLFTPPSYVQSHREELYSHVNCISSFQTQTRVGTEPCGLWEILTGGNNICLWVSIIMMQPTMLLTSCHREITPRSCKTLWLILEIRLPPTRSC